MIINSISKIFSLIGFDKVVSATVGSQLVVLISGSISLYFIGTYFSKVEQGYYYTFWSILGLQSFCELGLSQCIVNFSSHEFAHLQIDQNGAIYGDSRAQSRLISLIRLSLKWYSVVALVLMFFVGAVGHLFFYFQKDYGINWMMPWWSICFATGIGIILLPLGAILEGCNQYFWLAHARIWAKLAGSLCLWFALVNGAGLYSASLSSFLTTVLFLTVFFIKWRGLLYQVIHSSITDVISWRNEIWSFQWRIAIGWICGFFTFCLFNPVLFVFQGAAVAGQMGITWVLVSSLGSIASTWTNTKASRFGMYISKKEWSKLDILWTKSTSQSLIICTLGSVFVMITIMFIKTHYQIGQRFLGFNEILMLCLATIVNQIIFSENLYLRAHQKEPFLLIFILNAIFTSSAVYITGKYFNVFAVCSAYTFFLSITALLATAIFIRCKNKWHILTRI